jgi:hypothetical protein
MSSESTQTRRVLVALKLPTRVSALGAYATHILASMTGNAAFPAPLPALATVTSAVEDYQTAEAAALMRTKGAVATRNAKRRMVVQLLEQLKTYVQTVADASASDGAAIILGAGMAVRQVAVPKPRVFGATRGSVSGSVKLVTAVAAHRAAYNWQYSTDGAKTWISLPSTMRSKTMVTGLAAGTTVEFRCQALTKNGEGDWSQAVSLLVT